MEVGFSEGLIDAGLIGAEHAAVRADAWSKYIPDSAKRTADWTLPWVCGACIEPTFKEW